MRKSLNYEKKIEIAYDNFASKYDAAVGLTMASYAAKLLTDLQIPENPTVLDVGCGTGIATFELVRKSNGKGKFYGIDLSQKMVELAKTRATELDLVNVEFGRGNAERLDFQESSFDLVISNQAFHWIQNKLKALNEMFRVLKPAGMTALVFQGGPSFRELFEAYDRVRQRHPEYGLFDIPRILTLEETRRLFEKAGFKKYRIFAIHEITFINPSLFWTDEDLATSPWKIGLSSEIVRIAQKEVAGELRRIKPKDTLETTVYTVFGYGQKQINT